MTSPTYGMYVDWDGDGGLNIGDFEQSLEGWVATAAGLPDPVLAVSTTRAYHGSQSMLVTWSAGTGLQVVKSVPMSTFVIGTSYTLSAWVWVPTGGRPVKCSVPGISAGATSTVLDQWTRITYTFTATATTHQMQVQAATTPTPGVGEQTWIDMVRVIGPGEDLLATPPGVMGDVTIGYGRDQARALQPVSPGESGFQVDNVSRAYSPENSSSPLAGLLGPGREVLIEATYGNKVYTLFTGSIDDFDIDTTAGKWLASFSAIDGLARLKNLPVSTALHPAVRTGEAVNKILDAVNWTAGRDIDAGATTLRWWCAESDDAYQDLTDIVAAEGPTAFMHIGAAGEFVFRDRHHRLLAEVSGTSVDGEMSYLGAGTAVSAVNASVTPGLPSATFVPGDTLFVFAAIRNSGAGTPNTPAGYTLMVDASNMRVFAKYWRAGDTAPTVTFTGGVANADTTAQMAAFRGVSLSPVIGVTPVGSTLNGSAQDIIVPAMPITPPVHDALTLWFGWKADDWTSVSEVVGGIEVGEPDTTTGDDQGIVWNYRIQAHVAPYFGPNLRTFLVTGGAAAISRGACIMLPRPSVQATFRNGPVVAPDVEHDPPFNINFGWRDIVNQVDIAVDEVSPAATLEEIWSSTTGYSLSGGESRQFTITSDDAFWDAQNPTQDSDPDDEPDVLRTGGPLTFAFSRRSGKALTLTVTATSAATVTKMRLRAYKVTSASRSSKVTKQDTASITANRGVKPYKPSGPPLNAEDANAIADLILGKRATRLPVVTFSVTNGTPDQLVQILSRDLSDRIAISDTESGVDAEFYLERIEHTISDEGNSHEARFSAEKVIPPPGNVFRFDTAGAGFDDGFFGLSGLDDPMTMFIFDTAGHGFNDGLFAN